MRKRNVPDRTTRKRLRLLYLRIYPTKTMTTARLFSLRLFLPPIIFFSFTPHALIWSPITSIHFFFGPLLSRFSYALNSSLSLRLSRRYFIFSQHVQTISIVSLSIIFPAMSFSPKLAPVSLFLVLSNSVASHIHRCVFVSVYFHSYFLFVV